MTVPTVQVQNYKQFAEAEGTIAHAYKQLQELKGLIKKKSREIKDRLLADTDYSAANDTVVAAQKVRNEKKKAAMNDDALLGKAVDEMKAMRVDAKMWKETMSEALIDYQRKAGTNTFEAEQGTLFEIQTYAVVKPVTKK